MSDERTKIESILWEYTSITVRMNNKTDVYFVLKKYSKNDALILNMRTGACYFCRGIYEYRIIDEEHIKTNLFVRICDEVVMSWDDVSLVDFNKIKKIVNK